MQTYAEAENLLLNKRGQMTHRRTIQNNTRAIRNDDGSVGVQFHETQVVVFFPDGRVKLDTGGWLTMSTRERINRYAPVRVHSDKGRWMVVLRTTVRTTEPCVVDGEEILPAESYTVPDYEHSSTAFYDGMILTRTVAGWTTDQIDTAAEDKANAHTRKLITRWLRAFRENKLTERECAQCQFAGDTDKVPVGDELGLTRHLIEHLVNLEISEALMRAVAARCRATNWQVWVEHGIVRPEHYRKYFTERLYVGAVAAKNGTFPQDKRWEFKSGRRVA